MRHEYCYAKQYLAERDIELYAGDKRILEWNGLPKHKIYEYKTYIEEGIPLTETTQRKIISSYKELERLGFMIVARPLEYHERSYKGQKVIYEIAPKNPDIKGVGEIPIKNHLHWVEYDVERRMIRLIGASAGLPTRPFRGPWINLPERKLQPRREQSTSFEKYLDNDYVKNALKEFQHKLAPMERESQFKEIPEVAFMITANNEVVCFEDAEDPAVICAVGSRGCLLSNSKIIAKNGVFKISDLKNGQEVISIKKNNTRYNKIEDVIDNGEKEVYKVKTSSGREIYATNNHTFLKFEGNLKECQLSDLQEGDIIPRIIKIPDFEVINKDIYIDGWKKINLDWNFGFLMGLYLSEGHCVKSEGTAIGFTIVDDRLSEVLLKILTNYNIKYSKDYRKGYDCVYRVVTKGTRKLNDWIRREFRTGAKEKIIPNWVYLSPREFKDGLLSGYFSGDGSVYVEQKTQPNHLYSRIGFSTISKDLVEGIGVLLSELGINYTIKTKVEGYDKKYGRNSQEAYNGNISKFDYTIFFQHIKFIRDGVDHKIKQIMDYKTPNKNNYKRVIDMLKRGRFSDEELAKGNGIDGRCINNFLRKMITLKLVKREKDYHIYFEKFNQCIKENRIRLVCDNKLKGKTERRIVELLKQNRKEANSTFFYNNIKSHRRNIRRTIDNLNHKGIIKKYAVKVKKEMQRNTTSSRYVYSIIGDVDLYLEKSIEFDKIVSIQPWKVDHVYDLKVNMDHNFTLANGVVVHNSGKTMSIHTMVDAIYHKDKGRIVIFNDRQRQFLTWSLPSSVEGFNRENQRLCHTPTPLPCIYLYPTDFNLREIDFQEEGIGFEITLPFESIMDNYKYFLQGRKNWELGGSERYFKFLRVRLKKCKTIEEVRTLLQEEFEDKKGLKGTWEKILKTMEDLYEMKFLDINTDVPSKWKIRFKGKLVGDLFPVSAALSVGLLPIVENGHIYTKDYYPQYMRWLLQDLYENLLNKRLPYKERTWEVIDEIGQIYKKGKKRTVAAEALIDTITEGRKPNLGCLYTLQSWAKIDEEIQLNTTDVLAFNTNQPNDVAELGSAFSLDRAEKEELKNLKTFECLAMTKNRWVVYDMDGNRYHTDEVMKGRIIFPTSQHTKVGE